jgi:hypothetical protein
MEKLEMIVISIDILKGVTLLLSHYFLFFFFLLSELLHIGFTCRTTFFPMFNYPFAYE